MNAVFVLLGLLFVYVMSVKIVMPFWRWLNSPMRKRSRKAEDAISDAVKCTKRKTGRHKCHDHNDDTDYT